MNARPLLTLLRVRAATAAVTFTACGWLYLMLAAPTTDVPFGQRAVPSPLIWPATTAVSTMLLSCSQLSAWELRAARRLWPFRCAVLGAGALANLTAVVTLVHPSARLGLLTWFASLQAIALASTLVFGERAWLPLVAVVLAAIFDLAQDGSLLLRVVNTSRVSSLVIAAGVALGLMALVASDTGARRAGS